MDKTKKAIKIFNKFAVEYQSKYMDVDLYADTLDLFCTTVEKENAHILDLACGPGNITRYLLKKRPDFKILGIDLSSKMIELAKTNNPSAEFRVMDCRDIYQLNNNFDAVICGFGLPYLSKEEAIKLIGDAAGLLNRNGVLYLSTMEDDYTKSDWKGPSSGGEERLFMHYHEAAYLEKALEENGFKIIDLQRKVYPAPDGAMITDLILIGKKTDF